MIRGKRFIKFVYKASNHRQVTWGLLPDGAEQPYVGMEIPSAIVNKVNHRKSSRNSSISIRHHPPFRLDGKTRIVDQIIPPHTGSWPETSPSLLAIGLNYKKHAQEVGMPLPRNPVVLSLSGTSIVGHEHPIVVPKVAQDPLEIDYEVELGIIIGQSCKDVSVKEAMDFVLGLTIANDVSARRWQGKRGGGQWSRAKSFDTFTPLGPVLFVPDSRDMDMPMHFNLKTWVNGTQVQNSNTSDMIFNVSEIVSYLSQGTTLERGTVIITGTPEGVGYTRKPPMYLQHGDEVECEVEGIGILRNTVRFEGMNERAKEEKLIVDDQNKLEEIKADQMMEEGIVEDDLDLDIFYDSEALARNAVFDVEYDAAVAETEKSETVVATSGDTEETEVKEMIMGIEETEKEEEEEVEEVVEEENEKKEEKKEEEEEMVMEKMKKEEEEEMAMEKTKDKRKEKELTKEEKKW